MVLTPLLIEVLLHHYCSGAPFRDMSAPAVKDAFEFLLAEGALVCLNTGAERTLFGLSPKGKAWVLALCNVPPPKEVFVDQLGNVLTC